MTNPPARSTSHFRTLYGITFFTAVAMALPAYVQSSWLKQFVSPASVGWWYASAMLAAAIAINLYPAFVSRLTNYRTAIGTLILYVASVLVAALANSLPLAAIGLFGQVIFSNLLLINQDLFIERFSRDTATGRIRTTYFTFINLGWFVSPLLAGVLVSGEGYRSVYLLAAAVVVPVILVLAARHEQLHEHIAYRHHHTLTTIRHIIGNRDLRDVFWVAFLLQFFYGVAVVYVPLYLHATVGFAWSTLGILFTLMLFPFLVIEIPAGILADTRWGEREMMALGFVILALAVIAMAFVQTPQVLLWGIILVSSRVGAALVEAMRESYFFKLVSVKDVDYIHFFRIMQPGGYLGASVAAALLLPWISFPAFLLAVGILLGTGVYAASRLHDTR